MAKKLRAKRLLGIFSNIAKEDPGGNLDWAREVIDTESTLNEMGVDLSKDVSSDMPGIMMSGRMNEFQFKEGSLPSSDQSASLYPGKDLVIGDISSKKDPNDILDYLLKLDKTPYNVGDLANSINESGKIPYKVIGGTAITNPETGTRTPSLGLLRYIDRYELGNDPSGNPIRWIYFTDGSRRIVTEKEWSENINKIKAFNRIPKSDPIRNKFYEVLSSSPGDSTKTL